MNTFTYEEKDTKNTLETYEWDRTWWDNTAGEKEAHIFIVGDSISCGYRENPQASAVMKNKVSVDGLATSKAVDNTAFVPMLELYFAQQKNPAEIIFFNNGLHGWHLSTPEYEYHYRNMVKYLKTKCEKVVVVLTTPIRDNKDLSKYADRNPIVIERNNAAKKVAEEENCPVLDLYSPIENMREIYSQDGVHLLGDGYEMLAKMVYEKTKELVK